ncbi:hypothetical protein D3C73_1293710 [compost metagenome]
MFAFIVVGKGIRVTEDKSFELLSDQFIGPEGDVATHRDSTKDDMIEVEFTNKLHKIFGKNIDGEKTMPIGT